MSEPWLSGPLPGIDPLLAPLFYTFEQARQELRQYTDGMTVEQIWSRPHGLTAIGFHIRHIGGAAERLGTYLKGGQLTDVQIAAMKAETEPGATREQLLANMESAMMQLEDYVRVMDPATLREPRGVGRKNLPTTVNGLLVHIAEHTFRHLGQAVTTAKLISSI